MKLYLLTLLFLIGFISPIFSQQEIGNASYYADKFKGKPTASGEKYLPKKFTAAHKTYAFGTKVEVTSLKNGKKVVVVINDRGPFVKGRIIDLSMAAAEKIDLIQDGVTKVSIRILEK